MSTEKKVGKYKDNCIYSIKALPEWRHWLHMTAKARGVHASEIISEAVEAWAKSNGIEPPPQRWRDRR